MLYYGVMLFLSLSSFCLPRGVQRRCSRRGCDLSASPPEATAAGWHTSEGTRRMQETQTRRRERGREGELAGRHVHAPWHARLTVPFPCSLACFSSQPAFLQARRPVLIPLQQANAHGSNQSKHEPKRNECGIRQSACAIALRHRHRHHYALASIQRGTCSQCRRRRCCSRCRSECIFRNVHAQRCRFSLGWRQWSSVSSRSSAAFVAPTWSEAQGCFIGRRGTARTRCGSRAARAL
jgi:hypothetical protein